MEARATRALGVPVQIGRIEGGMAGWTPYVELRDVVVHDAAHRPALRLGRVWASLSGRSLPALDWRFRQLLVEGADVDVRRDAAGRFHVAGLDVGGPAGGGDGDAADWFFKQREFVLTGGRVRWTDEQRNAAPLVLADVQVVVRNGLRRHELRIDATPPEAWGERFGVVGRFRAPLIERTGGWQQWSGIAYVNLPRADVRELRRHVDLPFELTEGDGALRVWLDVRDGRPTAATADLALRAVSLRLADDVDRLALEQVHGRVVARRLEGDGVSLSLQDVSFRTGDGLHWPGSDLAVTWRPGTAGNGARAARGGDITADRLDLDVMAQVAACLPLGGTLHRLLDQLEPRGVVTGLGAGWEGALDAPDRYRVRATLRGLALRGQPAAEPKEVGRPGLDNADIELDATERGGSARLAVAGGAIDLPGIFEASRVPLDRLAANLAWTIEPVAASAPAAGASAPLPKVTVQVNDAQFANADASGELRATWTTGPGVGFGRDGRYPGRLELDSTLTNGVAARTARYLPLSIPAPTRHYVEQAVKSGTLARVNFRVKGRLRDFPFDGARSPDGVFRIEAQLVDVGYDYWPADTAPPGGARPPAWPALADVNGQLVLDRTSFEIRNATARLGGAQWSRVQVGIRDLDAPVVTVDGTGRGALADMLQFVNTTPVGPWMGRALAEASANGPAELNLGLSIPIEHSDDTRVSGRLTLAGNDLRIVPGTPLLGAARGRVDFTGTGFSVAGASARLLGGDATFEGGSQPDGSLRFSGQGIASADGLRQATELPALARAAQAVSGQAAYRAQWGLVRGHAEVQVTSNLVGLAIGLPAPLNKAADTPLALRVQSTLAPESLASGAAMPLDTVRFELGNLVQAQYQRELGPDTARVLRGGIGVMAPAPWPAAGVAANVQLPALDVDDWQEALERLAAGPVAAAPASVPGTPATASVPADSPAAYAPDTVALQIRALSAGSRRLDRLVAGITRSGGVWRANVDAEQLGGYVEYRPAGGGSTAGGVYARLARLSLPKSEADQVESLLDEAPTTLPALDIVVDDFELRGKRLGRLEVEAVNHQSPREWRLSKLNLVTPEARFSADGSWAAPAGAGPAAPRRSVMNFQLALDDSGALLERLGMPHAIKGGKGRLQGQAAWTGAPLSIDYPSLSGKLHVAIDSGQFLKAEPGVARLLGVLSLQALPRRFFLDFRDLFQQGFAFDNVTGDVAIEQGVARTNNLRMRGVQAVVLMDGRADLAGETQDLRVWVVPEINAGTASLAYAVINPAIGLGTFLAQVVLRKQLVQAGTREFRVHGPWDDPKVDPVERKLTDDVPSTEPPADAETAAGTSAPAGAVR